MNTKLLTILGFVLVFGLAIVYIFWIIGPKIFNDVKFGSILPAPSATPTASSSPISSSSPSASPVATGFKSFTSKAGISMQYPAKWGLLTCSNSNNFEFDPTNSQDELNVICEDAKKPITVVFSNNACGGGQVESGFDLFVIKSQDQSENYLTHTWCIKSNPVIQITNRESQTTNVAADSKNYVNEIDKMINSIQFN